MLSGQKVLYELLGGNFQNWFHGYGKTTGGGTTTVTIEAEEGKVHVITAVVFHSTTSASGIIKNGETEIAFYKVAAATSHVGAESFPRLHAGSVGNALELSINSGSGDTAITVTGYTVEPET